MNKNQFKDIIKNKFRGKFREKPRRNQRKTHHDNNNHAEIKIYVTGDFIVYFLLSDELSSIRNVVNVMKHQGSTTDDMVDYVKPVTLKKASCYNHAPWYE